MKSVNSADEYFDGLDNWKEEVLLLRSIIINAGLTETIKWGGPCYTWGKDNIVGIAAFKGYAGLWFFQGGLLKDEKKYLMNAQEGKTKAMLQWRFTSKEEIQNASIADYIFESIENFKNGIKIKPVQKDRSFEVPTELLTILDQNSALSACWDMLSLSCKREYAEYITEAKRPETKQARLEKIIPMMMDRKGLNDKYKK